MNIIIVESKNDKAFISALVNHLNISNTEVDPPIILEDDDYVLLNGSDPNFEKPTLLSRKIKELKSDLIKNNIKNIGILLDLDNNTQEEKIHYINNSIRIAFTDDQYNFEDITEINRRFRLIYKNETFYILCHFTNFKQQGELETILKNITTKDSTYADCLENWRLCLIENSKTISEKDFNKFWLSNYLRFDTCTTQEKKQAARKCSFNAFDYIMKNKPDIFNFDSNILADLRAFLELFREINEQ